MTYGRKATGTARRMAFAGATALSLAFLFSGSADAQTQSTSSSSSTNPLAQSIQQMLSTSPQSIQQVLGGQASGPQILTPSVTTQQTIIPPAGQSYPGQPGTPTLPGPTQSMTATQPQTQLEQIMSQRAGVPLYQFGYDQMGVAQAVSVPQVGAMQDNYILGPGDQLDITLRGQENADYRVTIDRDGRIILPNLAPVNAAGRTLGAFRTDLTNAMHRTFVATQVYLSIAQLRQVSVMVVGEVNNPGLRTLTGLSTPTDAILISGGVKKTGSLRNIKIYRNGQQLPYDLYDILTQSGRAQAILLANGDRIVVPPLGATVAVTGWVRRPAIYELPQGAAGMSARSLIALAGGLEVRGRYRLMALELRKDGRQEMTELGNEGATIRDSEILYAQPSASETVGGATLSGSQTLAGRYSIGRASKLSSLLKAPGALGDSPYALFGVIVRRDPHTYVKTLIAFSPAAILEGADDIDLASNDIVRIFTTAEGAMLSKTAQDYQAQQSTQSLAQRNPQFNSDLASIGGQGFSTLTGSTQLTPSQPATSSALPTGAGGNGAQANAATMAQLQQLQQQQQQQQNANNNSANAALLSALGGGGQQQNAQQPGQQQQSQQQQLQLLQQQLPQPTIVNGLNIDQETLQNPAPVPTSGPVQNFTQLTTQIGVDPLGLINFLIDHEVRLDGAVRAPGVYIVGPHTNLQDLVSVAGGASHWADQNGIDLITTDVDSVTGRATTVRRTLAVREGTLASYTVRARDELRFNQIYTQADGGQIIVQGEVRSPGTYPILHGEHLSEVLVRAGGLTDVAYPYGTVYLRQSVAALEEIGYQRAADDVERQILVGMGYAAQAGGSGASSSGSALQGIQGFVLELRQRKPLGRMSIIADPSVLAAHPEKDPILEAGDVIYIPQRPSTVTVLGEVMQPGSYPVDATKGAKDYIALAGGNGPYADSGWTFVVFPDGTAQQIDSSWFTFNRQAIPPGSVVYVPRDLFPLNWAVVINDAGEIFKDMAISAAALYAISSNNNIRCTANRCN